MGMDRIRIEEDKFYQQGTKKTYSDLNTDKQVRRAQFYVERYDALKAEMQEREEEWNNIEKQYKCERDYIADAPNSFIPVMAPIINGQIASMIDQNIAAKVKGMSPSDQHFASSGQKIVELFLRHNKIKQVLKSIIGRYLKFGLGWIAIEWDPDALDGFGMPIIRNPQTTKVFVDGNIKDILDYQKARYIIEECGYQSIMWAREEYGDEIANHLMMNTTESDFDASVTDDEQFSFLLLKVWHRNNKWGNLQLLEIDDTGFVLRDSDPESPYYEHVNNEYPYYPIGLYQEEGEFHRFGDGKILYFIQDTINKLYDEIINACKFCAQSRTFIDPDGEMDPDDFDADPSHPIPCRNPGQNVFVASSGNLNPVVERLVANLMNEARRATRFSDLMMSNAPGESMTATQAGIQTTQGNVGISDKKGDVSEGLRFAATYAINLCIELWDGGQWFRVTENEDDFEWIDGGQLAKVPVLIPTDETFRNRWRDMHPDSDISLMPKMIQYVPENDILDEFGDVIARAGEGQTKKAAFDIAVSIGEGLPSSPIALFNIMLSLAQLSLIDETTGMARPVIGYAQFRKMMEETLGIPFDEAMEQAKQLSAQGIVQPAMMGGAPMQGTPMQGSGGMSQGSGGMSQGSGRLQPINMSATIPGANVNGKFKGPGTVPG